MTTTTICKEAVRSNDYKGFAFSNRGSEETVARLLEADCVRRISDNLAFAYFYDPEPEDVGEEYPFGIMQKCYGLLSEEELAASGVLQLREGPFTNLRGSGVLLGFVDTGINFADTAFRNTDGSTRLMGLWDQTLEGETTVDFAFYGREFSEEEINLALQSENPYDVLPSWDENGHGSALVRAAAGSEERVGRFPMRGAGVSGQSDGVSQRHRCNKRKPTPTPTVV